MQLIAENEMAGITECHFRWRVRTKIRLFIGTESLEWGTKISAPRAET